MKQKKILGLLLSFVMMLLIFPTNIVFAEIDANIFAGGDGSSAATAYEISNLTQLKAFRDSVNEGNNYSGQYIKLTADIDLEGSEDNQWEKIGDEDDKEFKGIFDGNGKTISGLYYAGNITGYIQSYGFFGYIQNATVENLTVGGELSTTDKSGVWMGFGGIVGYAGSSNITNCTANVTFNAGLKANYVGGVVGYTNGSTISNCTNKGSVYSTAEDRSVGGICGLPYNRTTIENCTNEGTVSGKKNVGGIAGDCATATIKNCVNKAAIGGIGDVGENVGGIAGEIRGDDTIAYCYNTDAVSGTKYVGGIVGYGENGNINDTYNIGTVTGKDYVGGIAGHLPYTDEYYGAIIDYCNINCAYNAGDIVGDTNVGQIYGAIDTTNNKIKVTNTYAIERTEGQSAYNTSGEPKTAEQFANGEVAYLLQSVKGEDAQQIWGQKIGTDKYPTFSTAKVYEDTYNETKVYRNEIDGNKILLLGADKKSATAVLSDVGTYAIIFADYEGNRCANVQILEVTVTKPQAVRVTSDEDITLGTGDKIMLWDNLENLTPMCKAYEVK